MWRFFMDVIPMPRPTPPPPPCSIQPQLSSPEKGIKEEKKKKKKEKMGAVRIVGNKNVEDSEKKEGKICHQCRQRKIDFVVSCKNQKGNKQCPIMLCNKCLLNRYGERAEEVALMDDWKCPKCRGICNCSYCMKKKGHKPTGALFHIAKEKGFSSVSELLQTAGLKRLDDSKEPVIASPRILGKENSLDGSSDLGVSSQNFMPISGEKKLKKMKRERLKEISNSNGNDDGNLTKSGQKKPKSTKELAQDIPDKEEKSAINCEVGCVRKMKSQTDLKMRENTKESPQFSDLAKFEDGMVTNGVKDHDKLHGVSSKFGQHTSELQNKFIEPSIPLPLGSCITAVAGIELSSEDVGHALQFLEFAAAFGKVLDLRKGQSEAVLKELVIGQRERRSQYRSQPSLLSQVHSRLLNMIQNDAGDKFDALTSKNLHNSWFRDLGEFLSQCQFKLKEFSYERFEGGNEGYDELKISEKLQLLNFLCDEALNTNVLRKWIDDENSKFLEKQKTAKEKVLVAKDKEKQLNQKMQDEVVKAINERNGVPLSISEHEALVSQIKSEAAEAHAEMLKAMSMVHQKRQKPDAVRTDVVVLDVDGRAFWRLHCHHGLSDILLQDMEGWSSVAPDKWFCYAPEQKEEVENYMSYLRRKRLRVKCY